MGQVDSGTGEDGDAGCAVRLGENVIGKAAGVENLQCPGHRGEGTAGRVHVRPAFENDDRSAAPGEVAGRGQSSRSGTDDEYVDALWSSHDQRAGVASAGFGYQRRMSSGVEVGE